MINVGLQSIASIVDYIIDNRMACSIFLLPLFIFDYLEDLGNVFANLVFRYVIYLAVRNNDGLKHEFFVWKDSWTIKDNREDFIYSVTFINLVYNRSYLLIEYPDLTSLDMVESDDYYLEQFFDETKAHVLCLTELKLVTKNFTCEVTRCNCTKVKRLILDSSFDNS